MGESLEHPLHFPHQAVKYMQDMNSMVMPAHWTTFEQIKSCRVRKKEELLILFNGEVVNTASLYIRPKEIRKMC